MTSLRHVRTLQLTSPREGLIRRGAILIEDALRTATLPECDGSRLVLVRRLSLGRIGAGDSPAAVALRIERRFGHLRASAVPFDAPAAENAPAVFFRDEIEPYLALALRLARGQDPEAWFWSLAVRNWRPGMPREEALRTVLFSIFDTEPGPSAAIALLRELLLAGQLPALASALRRQDGQAFLDAFGWAAPECAFEAIPEPPTSASRHTATTEPPDRLLSSDIPATEPFTSSSSSLLSAAAGLVRGWGATDPRSLCLSGVLVSLDKPSRWTRPDMPGRCRALVCALIDQPTYTGTAGHQEPRGGPSPASLNRLHVSGQAEPAPVQATRSAAPDETSHARTRTLQYRTVEAPRERQREINPVAQVGSSPGADAVASGPAGPRDDATAQRSAGMEATRARQGADQPMAQHGAYAVASGPAGPRSDEAPQCSVGHAAKSTSDPESGRPQELELPLRPTSETALSHRAGLFFLVPVLQRAGLPGWIDNHPEVWECDIPLDVLRAVAHRLETPPDDPVLLALRTNAPTAPSALVDAWVRAARRWARRVARLRLASLVCRAGYVSSTRTHIDVYLRSSEADIRVRRAGLDLDPGWIPWFGRVIHFHYLTGSEFDAQ